MVCEPQTPTQQLSAMIAVLILVLMEYGLRGVRPFERMKIGQKMS